MTRPSSGPRMAEGEGRTLGGVARPAAGMGRGHEGDDERGPQFRDCARMVHKTWNVLDKLPKGAQPKAKSALHAIYEAETRAKAEKAFDLFVATYEAKYPKAVECLVKDREASLVFYDFPADHWRHIRTANPIESTFATV